MHACMYDYATKTVKLGLRFKSMMVESMVRVLPHGRDYGFTCTCIMDSTKFPKSLTPSGYYWVTGLIPGPTIFVRKSRLSEVS